MRARLASHAALAVLLAATGCNLPPTRSLNPPVDAGRDRDQRPLVPDGPLSPASWKWTAADQGQTPAVALRLEELSGQEATLVLVGHGIPSLQGIAFRLSFPPQQVTVLSSATGPAWAASGHPVLSRFKARPEGELWGGISHRGAHGMVAQANVELARLTLRLTGQATIKLAFLPQRNLVVDPAMQRVKVGWLGGSFELSR